MNKIVIGIPTFKRKEMLVKLLQSIDDTNIAHGSIGEIIVLVVDNDLGRSAEQPVKNFVFVKNKIITLQYENCTQRGLATVRNRILETALTLSPNYIVCIDDDEYVTKNWLAELVSSITENSCEIVMGPVFPNFEVSVPNYISKWFRPLNVVNNGVIGAFNFESNNFVIDSNFIVQHNLRFDERFNFSGSEDTYFGLTASKYNAKILSSTKSIVFENIPLRRTKIAWLKERTFRTANVFTSILIIEKKYFLLFKKLCISLLYVVISIPLLLLYFFPIRAKYNGVIKLSHGLGGLSAFFKMKVEGY